MRLCILGLLLPAAMVALMGCAEKKDLMIPNLAPQTYVALADSVRNSTVYIQTVHWWGDDKDGEVIGFEYRWSSDPEQPGCELPADWAFTEETSKVFHLPVTDSTGAHTVEVRAVDDEGAADETPARLRLPVTNSPPTVRIYDLGALPDTTFPALRIKWAGDDPEGWETILQYRLWLDGSEESAVILSPEDTLISLGSDAFEERYGVRTLSLVAIDSGCDTSAAATYTWYVKEPIGDFLMVDDITSANAGNAASDRFYWAAVDSCIDAYSVLDIEGFGGGVSYPHNYEELLKQFGTVTWYNDPLRPGTESLSLLEDLLPSFVRLGGRFLLISLGAVGSGGALGDSIGFEVFGIDSLHLKGTSTNFDCKNWEISPNTGLGLDTLKVSGLYPGVECMGPAIAATPLFHIPPGTVDAAQTIDYHVGVMNSYGGGKAALITFPMSRANRYGNAQNQFCRVIELMLQ